MFGARGLPALLNLGFISPPYSVREWCRFFRKVSRLLCKSDCFHLVSFHIPCNPQFRCRGVSIISFACVMTGSGTLKNSQTAAEGLQYCISVASLYCKSAPPPNHGDAQHLGTPMSPKCHPNVTQMSQMTPKCHKRAPKGQPKPS